MWILPDKTIAVLERVARKGDRSRFIDQAVLHYMEARGKESLREQLAAGYRASAESDIAMAVEWFPLEEEAQAIAEAASQPPRKKPRAQRE